MTRLTDRLTRLYETFGTYQNTVDDEEISDDTARFQKILIQKKEKKFLKNGKHFHTP